MSSARTKSSGSLAFVLRRLRVCNLLCALPQQLSRHHTNTATSRSCCPLFVQGEVTLSGAHVRM